VQQTQKPVVIFCTSGSALLNYYPAVAEAFYSNIPLIVVSADRPANKIDIADGQTIRQKNVFLNHSLYNANLIEDDAKLNFNLTEIKNAIRAAVTKKGPVHINMPFEEPLYQTVSGLQLPSNLNFKINFKSTVKETERLSDVIKSWNTCHNKMILIGVLQPDEVLNKLLEKISEDESVIILTETTSNLYGQNFINTIDNLIFSLSDKILETLKPECLITVGGMVVSKRIKQFLRKFKPQYHWHLSKYNAPNTYFCFSGQIALPNHDFFKLLLKENKPIDSHFKVDWLERKAIVEQVHNNFMTSVPFSDLAVFNEINKVLPEQVNLQFSNSSAIRYSQLFHINKTISVFCNRGTSGIDGSLSTAIGAANATKKETLFITGDLSFFYDSNGLWNNYIPKNFKIVLINNSGGGIFRILPGPQSSGALKYFEAPHHLTAEYLCKMYGLNYTMVDNLERLKQQLPNFMLEKKEPNLLEIKTPSNLNDKILKDYFKILS